MQTTIKVNGMSCGHCVAAVTKALENVPGVETAQVSLENGEAVVTGEANSDELVRAVKEEGYEAQLQ
jgi:copper chaperone